MVNLTPLALGTSIVQYYSIRTCSFKLSNGGRSLGLCGVPLTSGGLHVVLGSAHMEQFAELWPKTELSRYRNLNRMLDRTIYFCGVGVSWLLKSISSC